MMKDFSYLDELYDVVDHDGVVTGQATRKEVHSNPQLIHRAVHVLVLRSSGAIVLQKRAMGKDVEPGKWDTSVGGHVDAGEDFETAARREMEEELGIAGEEMEFLYEFKFRADRESEDIRTYRVVYDGEVFPHQYEIDEIREWSADEIDGAMGQGVFTPNFEQDWRIFRSIGKQVGETK